MKKFAARCLSLVTCYLLLFTCCVPAHAARFVTYPMVGVCTGTDVNLRDQPNTKDSEVLRVANRGVRFIVLGEQKVGKQIWYEIENPEPSGFYEGSLWLSGKYLVPVYTEQDQRTLGVKMIVDILQKYGMTPERSIEFLLGRDFQESEENNARVLTWGGGLVTLKYRDDMLTDVVISGRTGNDLYDKGFLGIQIGDPVSKVRRLVDGSFYDNKNFCSCQVISTNGASEGITISWNSGGDRVTGLVYSYASD